MATGPQESDERVDSRWWYWIAAYPIVGLLFIPFIFLLIIFLGIPVVALGETVGDPAAPLAFVLILFAIVLGFSFFMIALAVFVMLPVALYFDAQAVAEANLEWEPDPFVYAIIGALQFFVTPLIGLIVAVYYLYRRHTDVGVP